MKEDVVVDGWKASVFDLGVDPTDSQ